MWKFDPMVGDIVFVKDTSQQVTSGSMDFGSEQSSDLAVDTGERDNETSEYDSGERIINGNI